MGMVGYRGYLGPARLPGRGDHFAGKVGSRATWIMAGVAK